MDTAAIIRLLNGIPSLSEIAFVTSFQGTRTTEEGEEIPVRVALLDYGPDDPDTRYVVVAEDDDGAIATGDAAASPEAAIQAVDWNDFVFEEDEDEDEE